MDTLLFQTGPVYWIGEWHISLIIAVAIVLIFVGGYISVVRLRQVQKSKPTPIIYTPIDPIHPEYIEKTLANLRIYLEKLYRPHHTTAHTAEEVTHYIEHPGLSDIIRELEHHEYQGTRLSTEEKTVYNERITASLH